MRVFSLPGSALQCDATSLDFPDGKFDVVYSFGVLHHIPEVGKTVAEIQRVLKPGGELLVMLHNRASITGIGARWAACCRETCAGCWAGFEVGTESCTRRKSRLAHLECPVERIVGTDGDHAVVILRVVEGERGEQVGPLTISETPRGYGG